MANLEAGRDAEPLRDRAELIEPFTAAFKPKEKFRIGAEAEKFGVLERSMTPVTYDGERGVVRVMTELARGFGWREVDVDPLLSLEKNGASVTLEPGAQLELSGAPLDDLHAISAELEAHVAELHQISAHIREESGEGIAWLGLGFHPLAQQADLPWVPKPRYRFMREYLPTRGAHGLDMMRRTATVQANFDYSSEDNAMRSLRLSMQLSPVFTAIFANSPFYEGTIFGGKSYRAKAWLSVDPSRQGLVPAIFRPGAKIDDYIEWALDAPMFLFLRDGKPIGNTGQTFRDFFARGFEGHRATYGDWVTHLNSMFPEVRLKRTLEVRGGDSLARGDVVGPAALFTGILYDSRAFEEAEALVGDFQHDELDALRPHVAMEGLSAKLRGVPIRDLASRVLDLAKAGLERRAIRRADGRDESVYLADPIRRVAAGRSPADDLLDHARAAIAAGKTERDAVIDAVLTLSRL
jgi:glutamate--cysteine ligase